MEGYIAILLLALVVVLTIWLRRIDYELQKMNHTLTQISSRLVEDTSPLNGTT